MGTTIINGNTKPIQGNGNVQLYCLNDDLTNKDLNSLMISGSLKTIINIDPNCEEPQFFIKAEANIFPLLEINNHNGVLDIGFKNNSSFSTNHPIECIIQATSLKSLSLTGSGSAKGNYQGNELKTTIIGSGKIDIQKNHTAEISPFIFKQILKSFKEVETDNNNTSNVSFNKDGSISVNQYSSNGNNTIIIGDNNSNEATPIKESFLSKLKKFF